MIGECDIREIVTIDLDKGEGGYGIDGQASARLRRGTDFFAACILSPLLGPQGNWGSLSPARQMERTP
jgi:hypothetical protein